MEALPATITSSHLWITTLQERDNDESRTPRERLRSAFTLLRSRASQLAAGIRYDLPSLTLHDIDHLDALWEIASTIVGEPYEITPAESFVLGSAIVLHDLGLTMAAVEGGLEAITRDRHWTDLVIHEYQNKHERRPTTAELEEPEAEIRETALFKFLRQKHASLAETLAVRQFTRNGDSEALHLIDDTELRQNFGRLVGQVAHSHWWSLSETENRLGREVGAMPWCPREWTIDPLKIACILRTADAAHLDSRRAPMFVRAISRIGADSEDHWAFQGKLNKPYLDEDSLVFTSADAFGISDATAWWLCLETVRNVDRELRAVDSILAEKRYPRFAARRVAGIDSPGRFLTYVPTDGWTPVAAMIHVSDLPRVIRSIGGEELYGQKPEVALRELIQNASDAVMARIAYEKRETGFGSIRVKIREDSQGRFSLEVSDNGIGMSERVLTEVLLDFGRAFWGSSDMLEEFPGLLSDGVDAAGKYGIGFFSVFMIADQVKVITRRSDAAVRDTIVLEFGSGLRGRPLIRPADLSEQLLDGGTRVCLSLTTNPGKANGLLYDKLRDSAVTLSELCRDICPSLGVDLFVEDGEQDERIIAAEDWISIDGDELLGRMRIEDERNRVDEKIKHDLIQRASPNLRIIRDENGRVFGRALLTKGYGRITETSGVDLKGVVTVGGLRACELSGIAGILTGTSEKAARDAARPLVPAAALKKWAEEQAQLVPNLWPLPEDQAACAQYVRMCGGDTGSLPIIYNQTTWYSSNDIKGRSDLPPEILIIDDFYVRFKLKVLESYELEENVFVASASSIPGLLQSNVAWPGSRHTNYAISGSFVMKTLAGAFIEAVASAWGVELEAVVDYNKLDKQAKVRVGTSGGRDLKMAAISLRKPS